MKVDEGVIKKKYNRSFYIVAILILLLLILIGFYPKMFEINIWLTLASFIAAFLSYVHSYFGLRYKRFKPNYLAGPIYREKSAQIWGIVFLIFGILLTIIGIFFLG